MTKQLCQDSWLEKLPLDPGEESVNSKLSEFQIRTSSFSLSAREFLTATTSSDSVNFDSSKHRPSSRQECHEKPKGIYGPETSGEFPSSKTFRALLRKKLYRFASCSIFVDQL